MAALIILAVLCLSPVLVRPDKKSSCPHDGESMCKDLKTAVKCNSFMKCMDTTWSKSKGDFNPCTACKELAAAIDKVVENKAVEDDIKAVLLKVCSMIPSKPVSDQCMSYVQALLPLAIQFLKNELKDPAELCAALCVSVLPYEVNDKKSNVVRELEPSHDIYLRQQTMTEMKRQVNHLPQCVLCLLVLKEVEKILPMKRSTALILKELNRICSVIPKQYSEKCQEFVKDNGVIIIDMILSRLGPNAICFGLKLCFTDYSAKLSDDLGRPTCDACEKLVTQLSVGQKSATDMLKTCSSMSGMPFLLCEDFVYSFKAQLNTFTAMPEKSRDVCLELRLCVRKVEAQLLGENECTWGPRHWCSDKAIATRCKATKYCNEHNWLLKQN